MPGCIFAAGWLCGSFICSLMAHICEVAFLSAGWLFVYHALCLLDNGLVLLPLLIAGCLVVLASCGVVLPLFTGDFCGCILLSFLLAGCLVLSFSVGVL
jgi:hypothetical protein